MSQLTLLRCYLTKLLLCFLASCIVLSVTEAGEPSKPETVEFILKKLKPFRLSNSEYTVSYKLQDENCTLVNILSAVGPLAEAHINTTIPLAEIYPRSTKGLLDKFKNPSGDPSINFKARNEVVVEGYMIRKGEKEKMHLANNPPEKDFSVIVDSMDAAERVAKALAHLAVLCGAKDDPF